jgi:hypothetical protein
MKPPITKRAQYCAIEELNQIKITRGLTMWIKKDEWI